MLINTTPNSMTNVRPGATAVQKIPTDKVVHRFDVKMEAAAAGGTPEKVAVGDWHNFVSEVVVKVHGRALQTYTPKILEDRATHNGYHRQAGILPIWQVEPSATNAFSREFTALVTRGMRSCAVEVKLKDGIEIRRLEVQIFAETPEIRNESGQITGYKDFYNPAYRHLRVSKTFYNPAAAGEREYSEFAPGRYSLKELHFTTDKIDNIEIRGGDEVIYEMDKATRENVIGNLGKTIVPGYTHVQFLQRGLVRDALPMGFQQGIVTMLETTEPNLNFECFAFSIEKAD